jgi:hypothetical protein
MNDVVAGSQVRWTICMNDPRETIAIRGRVRIVEGRRFAYVDVDGGAKPVCIAYADLTRIEPMPRGADIIAFPSRRKPIVDVGGMLLDPSPQVPA